MKQCRVLAVVTVVLALCLAAIAWSNLAKASPGSSCRHTPECGSHLVCVADSQFSSSGHCAAIRILP
jgi:hypothetical protein